MMRIRIRLLSLMRIRSHAEPDPASNNDKDPCGYGSLTLFFRVF